jgi:hypothetical protein
MKNTIPILLFFACISLAKAQSISPQVIASAGTHSTGSNIQLSWTLGEPVITTVSNGNNIITQGFHQTLLTVTAVDENNISDINITVFPNPTSEILNISLANNQKDLQLELFDINGKLLQTQQINATQNMANINMSEYARANYLLRLYAADGSINNTYKIGKINQ